MTKEFWGTSTKTLRFPFAEIDFVGVSESQVSDLECEFQSFEVLSSRQQSHFRISVQCRPYIRTDSFPFSVEELTVDQFYTPRCIQSSNQLVLHGYNFSSEIDFNCSPVVADIGIKEESDLSDPNIIENFLRIFAAHISVRLGGALLHSAGIVVDDYAMVFVGRSGVGKSTLSKKAFESGAGVLSDDMNLVLEENGQYYVHAVPFTGEYGRTIEAITGEKRYPVRCVGLLNQGDELRIRPENKAISVSKLYAGSPFVNNMDHASDDILVNLEKMVSALPIYQVVSREEDSFSDIMTAIGELN